LAFANFFSNEYSNSKILLELEIRATRVLGTALVGITDCACVVVSEEDLIVVVF